MPLKKEKGPFLGITSAFLKGGGKQAPMLQYFSRRKSVPDGGGKTDKQKGDS